LEWFDVFNTLGKNEKPDRFHKKLPTKFSIEANSSIREILVSDVSAGRRYAIEITGFPALTIFAGRTASI
jgi:hypothetical protein